MFKFKLSLHVMRMRGGGGEWRPRLESYASTRRANQLWASLEIPLPPRPEKLLKGQHWIAAPIFYHFLLEFRSWQQEKAACKLTTNRWQQCPCIPINKSKAKQSK